MRHLTVSILAFVFSTLIAIGQTNVEFKQENFKSKEDYDKATNYLRLGNNYFNDDIGWYYKALDNFKQANELNPNNSDLNYKIAECYYYANDNFQSLEYYKKAYNINPNISKIIQYRLGQGYQFRLQFDKAIGCFEKFKSEYQGKEKKEWLKNTDKRIKECIDGKDLMTNFVGGLVINIQKVNSEHIDHSPVISADDSTLFFTSHRPTEDSENVDEFGKPYEDIYIAKKDKNGNWQEAKNIGAPLNTKVNNATIGVSNDGNTLYIYDGKQNGGDILMSKFSDGEWAIPESLPSPINTKYQETSISFSPDGSLVYFVSNRPKGIGGRDIWIADVKEEGKYENARTLSEVINTPYDERSIFIHPDGKTMYFSSQGHKTMGGFDIFKSTMDENGNWGKPENIGYPVNTPGDDVFFVTSADNKKGYFSSLKLNSKGEQDIYVYIFPEKSKDDNFIVIKGTVKDENTKKPLPANLTFTDVETGETTNVKTDPKTGGFLVSIPKDRNYAINVTSDGYNLLSESINPHGDETRDFLLGFDITMNTIEECKPVVLNNIWFDFDKSALRNISYAELNQLIKFLDDCKAYNVEIGGHTCIMGPKEYNYSLSKRRAQSVVDYLISKGVNKDRLTSKGYGPDYPIADNKTRKGRIKNRRVEFKLLNK